MPLCVSGFSVNKTEKETQKKTAFKVALSKGDAVVVKEYLRFALDHINSADYAEDKKRRADAAKEREKLAGQEPAAATLKDDAAF